MPGYPDHDTVFGTGTEPAFRDVRDFAYIKSAPLERRLAKTKLEVGPFLLVYSPFFSRAPFLLPA